MGMLLANNAVRNLLKIIVNKEGRPFLWRFFYGICYCYWFNIFGCNDLYG